MFEDLRWVYDAFWELSTSRPVGMGLGGIPFQALDRYAVRYEVEDFEEFSILIRRMDGVYLSHSNEKTSKK